MNNYISIVPIRAGSKGFKNKNLAQIKGEPLYLRAVNQGLRVTKKCIVNTDIEEVLNKKFQSNIILYKRDQKYSQDTTPMDEVLKDQFLHLNLKDHTIILLQATSPLRSDKDISKAIKIYETGKYSLVMSVKKVNSGVLKYGYSHNNEFIPFNGKYLFSNRQNLPNVYSPNGAIYIFSVNEFLKKNCFPYKKIGFYQMTSENSIDIDKKEDLIEVNKLIDSKCFDNIKR